MIRLTSLVLLLVGCSQEGDTGSSYSTNYSAHSSMKNADANQKAAARWRGLKLENTSFTGFGKLPGGGLRANVGSFVAELPNDGALHLRHRMHDNEILVSLESWGRDGALRHPNFSIATQGKCIEDVLGQKIKIANKAYAQKNKCLTQAEQTDEGIEAWWRGGLDSFEQGWTIFQKPKGSDLLTLTVAFDGVLITKLQQDLVRFVDEGGKTWTYDGLNAWDANGQVLDAWFEPSGDGDVVIFVDDSQAEYPITVDPWFSTTGNEVVNTTLKPSGDILTGTNLTSSNYQPTNNQSWSDFGGALLSWELTGETVGSSLSCPYGNVTIIGNWDSSSRVWSGAFSSYPSGDNEFAHYRCGDLGDAGQFNWSFSNQGNMQVEFGAQIHPLGDTNDDDYGDILVTAPNWSSDSYSNRGRVFVFQGSASGLETSATVSMVGQADDEHFGDNVLTGGDINGDGFDDIVVAAPESDIGGTNSGNIYTFFGSLTGFSDTIDGTIAGNEDDASFGSVMDWAGDVNGDGYDDLIIGNRNNDTTDTNMGAAYIFYGSATGFESTPSVEWFGDPTVYSSSSAFDYDYFGYDVAGIGDINGDGYDDVAVSAPYHDSNGADAGKVYIYLGGMNGISATADYARYGSDSDYFGMDLKKIGDINGDGYAELYVDGYVWFGSSSGIAGIYDTQLNVDRWMGDIDLDGYDDVMYNSALCFGDSDGSLTCDSSRSNAQIVEDITGDGFYDYISSDPTYDNNKGRIYTYLAFEPDEDLDGYLASEDCNDEDASINPSATETCDLIDNDCDGLIDDEDAVDVSSGTVFYADTDSDGYGDAASTTLACTVPEGYVVNADDCDDTTALAKPGGIELPGDGIDQDCDGGDLCFADYDNDGYRSTGGTTFGSADLDCTDAGEASASVPATDCDDLNPTINPGATEIPDNGVDEDCNGGETCFVDADDDGYRSMDGATIPSNDMDCLDAGEGASAEPATDCDDTSASILPGGTEIVGDGIDQDCDGGDICYADADDDGFRAIGGLTVPSSDIDCTDAGEALNSDPATDCDDNDSSINPGVAEIVGDEFDQNCDGTELCFEDADEDGYRGMVETTTLSTDLDCTDAGEASLSVSAFDCDDSDAGMNPAATEVVGDAIDQNCDSIEICFVDADSDGYRNMDEGLTVFSTADIDCDDAGEGALDEPPTDCDDSGQDVNQDGIADGYSINPGAQEIIVDGIDQDCDGGDACFADLDGDGERDANNGTVLSADADCNDAGEADGSMPATDCDDNDPATNSAATEVINDGVDNDCDGFELCFVDADGDGHRDTIGTTIESEDLVCDAIGEAGASLPANDCDDSDSAVHGGAVEIVGDGIDQDCDGTELCYADADNDGFLDASGATVVSSDLDCNDAGEGLNTDPMTDCDDSDPNVYLGASETIDDGIDQDCDGVELCYADADNDNFRDLNGGTVLSNDMDCLDPGEGRIIDPATDCDDDDSSINPIASEVVGDGIDQNCDGLEECFVDADNDGYRETFGLTTSSLDLDCDDVGEGSIGEPPTDCDDSSAAIHPEAVEVVADGIDQDCDGGDVCYVDADGDSFRDASGATLISSDLDCDDAGEVNGIGSVDCNDSDSNVYPGAPEVVDNGLDEDCDGGDTCYVDLDDDGFRETTGAQISSVDLDCLDPGEGASTEPATDCNDNDININPNALEQPSDGIDSNCDGAEACYTDYDNDGFRAIDGAVIDSIDADCDDPGEGSQFEPATDCDDNDANVNPTASEIVADGIDQDCNGGDICYIDADADGTRGTDNATQASNDLDCTDFGEAEATVPATDCNDNDALINAAAAEIVADGIDQNCDGAELCYVDADSDGYREATGLETVQSLDMDCSDAGEGSEEDSPTDCDDESSTTNPGATEIIADGIDQNCDGVEICYADMDGDGYRTFQEIQSIDVDCDDAGEAYADAPIVDCDDQIAAINPGQEEVIDDGIDNDCDGVSEMSEADTDPVVDTDEEPATEPSLEVETVDDGEKEGCSTATPRDISWLMLVPAILFGKRRRRSDRLS